MKKKRFKPYCLQCYAPLEPGRSLCSRCGTSSPVSLRQKFWTREPRILEIEKALKVLIFVLALLFTGIIGLSIPNTGFMAGWFLAIPSLIAFPLWMTTSRLTARDGLFSGTYFWIAIFLLFAMVSPIFFIPLSFVFFLLAALTMGYSHAFSRWRDRRILQGQMRATNTSPE